MNIREKIKKAINAVGKFFDVSVYNPKWKCNACGIENGNGKYFCDGCYAKLPFVKQVKCAHCGRTTAVPEVFCLSCKDKITSLYRMRSVFDYRAPVSRLVKNLKYDGCKYIAEIFVDFLKTEYDKGEFSPDFITFVPMTDKAKRKRGYNQSELLANGLSDKIGVPIYGAVVKKHETARQATLSARERLSNLDGAYKITDKGAVRDKEILIIDDVMTTGATAETLAKVFLKAGAKRIGLLTVCSVPDINTVETVKINEQRNKHKKEK